MNPLVSVVIPTYNRVHVIGRAVDSVLGQTYRPVEVVVVDDGSTDGTCESLRAYGDSIVYVRQDNAGPAAARNRGIRESKGDLVAFLDSDDVWLPTKVERQVSLLQRAGDATPCCLCDTLRRMPNGTERSFFEMVQLEMREREGLWLNPAVVLATRFVLFCQAVMVRREALLSCGGFDERLWLMEDHDLALRLALRGPWAFTQEPLAVWCGANDDSNLSVAAQKQPIKLYESIEYSYRKILERERIPDDRVRQHLQRNLRWVRQRLLAERLASTGRILPRVQAMAIAGWVRLSHAWFGRLPSYPRVESTPIGHPSGGPQGDAS